MLNIKIKALLEYLMVGVIQFLLNTKTCEISKSSVKYYQINQIQSNQSKAPLQGGAFYALQQKSKLLLLKFDKHTDPKATRRGQHLFSNFSRQSFTPLHDNIQGTTIYPPQCLISKSLLSNPFSEAL